MSERLGHENPAFTLKQYAHVVPGMQAEAAAHRLPYDAAALSPALRASRCEAAVRQRPGRLVTRERCPDDARGSIVRLTPAGRSAIEAAAPNHVTTVRRFFLDPLSDDELDTLATLLDRLLAGLADTED